MPSRCIEWHCHKSGEIVRTVIEPTINPLRLASSCFEALESVKSNNPAPLCRFWASVRASDSTCANAVRIEPPPSASLKERALLRFIPLTLLTASARLLHSSLANNCAALHFVSGS